MRSTEEASAAFTIHVDHEDVVEENAREHFGPTYGDADDRAKAMKAGLVDAKGQITERGWAHLNKDIGVLETNAMIWLRKTFGTARDEGHDNYGDLVGMLWFDPHNVTQAHNILMGVSERVDFSDSSYGDFAEHAWKGISDFGASVLGGQIGFSAITPRASIEIAEETVDQHNAKRRAKRGAKRR